MSKDSKASKERAEKSVANLRRLKKAFMGNPYNVDIVDKVLEKKEKALKILSKP